MTTHCYTIPHINYMTEEKVAKKLGKKRMSIVEEVCVSNLNDNRFMVEVWLKDGYYFDGYFTTCCIQTFEKGYETLAQYWSDFINYFDHWTHNPEYLQSLRSQEQFPDA